VKRPNNCLRNLVRRLLVQILYYLYTYFFILYYISPLSLMVLDGNFALDRGPGTDYP